MYFWALNAMKIMNKAKTMVALEADASVKVLKMEPMFSMDGKA